MPDTPGHHTPTGHHPQRRTCANCAETFVITLIDCRYFERKAAQTGQTWPLPVRCQRCRDERRLHREAVKLQDGDVAMTCAVCARSFTWRQTDQVFYALQGFRPPTRCHACRRSRPARAAGGAQTGDPRPPATGATPLV